MRLQNTDTVYINCKKEENGPICGNLTITPPDRIQDQSKDSELFSVCGIDYDYGAIMKTNGSYTPYFGPIKYMTDENFGKAEKTFREALLQLVSEFDDEIILDQKFYKIVKIETKIDIGMP
jgi:hypothetical protein